MTKDLVRHYVYYLYHGYELVYVGRSINPNKRRRFKEESSGVKLRLQTSEPLTLELAYEREKSEIISLRPSWNKIVASGKGTLGRVRPEHERATIRKNVSRSLMGNKRCLGRPTSELQKKAVAEANRRRIITPAYLAKLSAAKSGPNHPMFGKHHTEVAKEKISKGLRRSYAND